MKLLILLLTFSCVTQAEVKDVFLNLGSYHFSRDPALNEQNYGLAVSFDCFTNRTCVSGFYTPNSFNEDSFYLGIDLPLKQKTTFKAGLIFGAVTGYHYPLAAVAYVEKGIFRISYIPDVDTAHALGFQVNLMSLFKKGGNVK